MSATLRLLFVLTLTGVTMMALMAVTPTLAWPAADGLTFQSPAVGSDALASPSPLPVSATRGGQSQGLFAIAIVLILAYAALTLFTRRRGGRSDGRSSRP
ncbi:MAG: hypothetical protein Kow0047_08430 [Anaerolineae bacterium]